MTIFRLCGRLSSGKLALLLHECKKWRVHSDAPRGRIRSLEKVSRLGCNYLLRQLIFRYVPDVQRGAHLGTCNPLEIGVQVICYTVIAVAERKVRPMGKEGCEICLNDCQETFNVCEATNLIQAPTVSGTVERMGTQGFPDTGTR